MAERSWLDAVLGLGPEWRVVRVERTREPKELRVGVERAPGSRLRCPDCNEECPGYDTRRREWRNLDAWGYKTFLVCDVPRVRCREHGVLTMQVPWAEGSSRYTAQFEAEVIRWLKEASVQAVARRMRLSWNAADGIMQRAVARGLARRRPEEVRRLSVDETSFRRRHRYVTVVSNPETGRVLHVAQGRGREALAAFYEGLGETQRAAVESVSMDMWAPYIAATLDMIPHAWAKIAFDRFHVAKHLGDAVDKVRRAEHRALLKEGNAILSGTRFQWLEGPAAEDARGEAGVREAARRHAADGPGVGAEGSGRESPELPEPKLGDGRVEAVARIGFALPPGARRQGRPDDPQSSLGHCQRRRPPRHQRSGRRHQQPDQDREGAQPGLSQPGTLRERHLLPSRRPRPLPR